MKQKKHDLIPFSFYDLCGIARHLEKRAAQGWMIEKLSNFGWRYRAIPPQKLRFAATYYPPASDFEPEPSEGELTFQDFCLHSGWKFVGSNGPLQVFCTDQPDPLPIHTEPGEELRMIRKMSRKALPFWIIMLLITLAGTYGGLATAVFDPIHFWTSPSPLYSLVCYGALLVYFGADLFTYLRWMHRAKQAALQGEFLFARGCHRILLAALFLAVAGLALYLLALLDQPLVLLIFFVLIGYLAVLCLAVNGVKKFLKKQKVPARLNLVLTLGADLLLAFGMMAGLTWGIFRLADSDLLTWGQPQSPLSLSRLAGVEEDPGRTNSYGEHSLFASREEYHLSPSLEETVQGMPWLDYTLFKTWVPGLDSAFSGQLYREAPEDHPSWEVSYQPVDPEEWGALEAYQLFEGDEPWGEYLLRWKGTVAQLHYYGDLSPQQKALIGQTLAGT